MAGVWWSRRFPVYKNGFPKELIEEFEKQIGRKTIGNKPASGTEIIKELRTPVRTASRLCTRRATACFRSPRMRK